MILMKQNVEYSCDVLIIGSGAAGLSLALRLAEHARVMVLSKGPLSEGATYYAQGGIAAVSDEKDSIESHVNDTRTPVPDSVTTKQSSLPPVTPRSV